MKLRVTASSKSSYVRMGEFDENLKKSFKLSIRSLLTVISKEGLHFPPRYFIFYLNRPAPLAEIIHLGELPEQWRCLMDVWKAFPTFTDVEKQSLHRMFLQVIKSLHENIEEEFESICQESKVGITLDTVEQLVEEHKFDILSKDKTDIGEIREKISKAKKDEIQYLINMLRKVEDENNMMKARIESLKEKQDFSLIIDVAEKLGSWNAEY